MAVVGVRLVATKVAKWMHLSLALKLGIGPSVVPLYTVYPFLFFLVSFSELSDDDLSALKELASQERGRADHQPPPPPSGASRAPESCVIKILNL